MTIRSEDSRTFVEITVEPALAAFYRHRVLASVVCLGIFGMTAAISLLLPKQYESSMKVLVKSERADLVVSPEANPAAAPRGEVTESQINSEIELLTSSELLADVVNRCQLAKERKDDGREIAVEKAIRQLRKNLKIAPARKADIINVAFTADSPKRAASVLSQLATSYLEMHLRVHRTAGTQDFFRNQTDRYASDLKTYETQLNDFRKRNNLVSIGQQKDLIVRKLLDSRSDFQQADTAWREASKQVEDLERQLNGQTQRVVTQNRTAPNQYSVERLNTMLAELRNRRSQSLMKFRADDRTVVEIDEEIANTQAALDSAKKLASTEQVTDLNPAYTAIERSLGEAQIRRNALAVRRDSLGATSAGYRNQLAHLETETGDYDSLARGAKKAEENYLLYARKQEEARIANSLDQQKVANVSLAEAPVEHLLPTKPNLGLNLLIGAALAIFASLAAVFGLEYLRGEFHTPAQIEHETGVPVLATVSWKQA